MASPDSPDAQTAYALQRALVDLQVAGIERALQVHEAVRPIDSSRLRNSGRSRARLAEIVALLTRTARND